MTHAAIDVGSNSVRMLLQQPDKRIHAGPQYFRHVTRLAGDFNPKSGLAPQSMARTLDALERFSAVLQQNQVAQVRAVGTAVLRQAVNSFEFLERVRQRTGINIEIIDGDLEAGLSCRGILSVLSPMPKRALMFDIGGGSTEIILYEDTKIRLQKSFSLGVVRLYEDYSEPGQRYEAIRQELSAFVEHPIWLDWQRDAESTELVGTAGTVTTLAALKLKMVKYDGRLVNNLVLERRWLDHMGQLLSGLSLEKRARLAGMEEGRADVIVPGLQIVRSLLDISGTDSLRVADSGLLEGLLL